MNNDRTSQGGGIRLWKAVAIASWCLYLVTCGGNWWHLIDESEPFYFKLARLGVAVVGSMALIGAWFTKSVRIVAAVGLLVLLLPWLIILGLAFLDPGRTFQAIYSTDQADRLWSSISSTFITPHVPWITFRAAQSRLGPISSYTILDALESITTYTKAAFYLASVSGLLLFASAMRGNRRAVVQMLRQRALWAIAILAIGTLSIAGRSMVGAYYLHAGIAKLANGQTQSALSLYQKAGDVDPRLAYDVTYQESLGELYSVLGDRSKPAYWMSRARLYAFNSLDGHAYSIYRDHLDDYNATPTMRLAATALLMRLGSRDFRAHRFQQSLSRYFEAKRLDPTNIEATFQLANALTQLRRYSEAVHFWKETIRMNEQVGIFSSKWVVARAYRKPISGECWNRLSWCYYQLGQLEPATQCAFNAKQQGSPSLEGVPNVLE